MADSLHYRLSIAPGLEAFRPELEYACDFLDRCYFVRRCENAQTVLHYGDDPPADAVAIAPLVFPNAVRVDCNGIHPDPRRLSPLLAGPCDDALGLIFCLLSRLEERGAPYLDRYGRFSPPAGERARYSEPLADHAACELASRLTGDSAPANRTSYEVVLTHDVDRLRGYHRPLQPVRTILGDLVKRRAPGLAAARLQDAYLSGEPWRSVEMLMDLSEVRNATSRFYFMGPTESSVDSPYALTMSGLLRKVTARIQVRGHIVGFHPGVGTATDAVAWNRQRMGLEAVVGQEVREGRQHALDYDAAVTPEIWDRAGMVLDTTLAFPEVTGFRSGTCRRFAAYSLRRRQPLRLEQIATAIMDFGLLGGKYRDLGVETALAECQTVVQTCRRFGGALVVLYHTGQTRQPMRQFYERLLNIVFATPPPDEGA